MALLGGGVAENIFYKNSTSLTDNVLRELRRLCKHFVGAITNIIDRYGVKKQQMNPNYNVFSLGSSHVLRIGGEYSAIKI